MATVFDDVLHSTNETYLSETQPTISTRKNDSTIEYQCPTCNEWYTHIANHWGHHNSTCTYPNIGQKQWDMIHGLMMGDGSIDQRDRKNPSFQISNTNTTFLQYLADEFGYLTNSLSVQRTAKEVATHHRESGFRTHATAKNRYDQYLLRLKAHPQFNSLRTWVSDGKTVFQDITVSPAILRMWYASDGSLVFPDTKSVIEFTSKNESDRPETIHRYFEQIDIECSHTDNYKFQIPHSQLDDFFDYIGHDPVPGFEYKWSYNDIDRQKRLYRRSKREDKTQTHILRD